MIWRELKESLIFLELEETDYKAVLQRMGTSMIREGYARDTYVQALLERERTFPTGLDIHGIGVAIPHTDVCHVKKEGIALAVLKKPVVFRQMGDESIQVPVRFIFMLAVLNPDGHLQRLQSVLDIIQDAGLLEQLFNARECGDIIRMIREKEEK